MVTPHEILGLPQTATPEEAKQAFKRLALRHHPDKPTGSVAKFKLLNWALGEFLRIQVCSLCSGKGKITVRNGLAARDENCPRCWKKE